VTMTEDNAILFTSIIQLLLRQNWLDTGHHIGRCYSIVPRLLSAVNNTGQSGVTVHKFISLLDTNHRIT